MASFQAGLDRIVRRLRRGRVPVASARRRLLIVQIDGLSRSVLEQALRSGSMPFVGRRLLRTGRFRLSPMSVGLPTSTPAFQMSVMYGVKPDIPGFHYYDRRAGDDVYFPRVGDAARVEAAHARGRTGILRGGSSYGCIFGGGAERDVFTFAALWRPGRRGVVSLVSSLVVLSWVVAKGLGMSASELVQAALRRVRHPSRARRQGWRWLALRVGCSIWLRQLYTLIVSSDLYGGVPAVYVNFIDYDVFAHAFGPRHPYAIRSLRGVDASIRQLSNVLRRVPEHAYDLYILSDHGQTQTTPYQSLHRGVPLEHRLFDDVLARWGPRAPRTTAPGEGLRWWVRAHGENRRRLLQGFINYLDEDFPATLREIREAHQRDGVRVVSAGPNAFVYFVESIQPLTLDQIDARYPGLVDELSRHRGIGFVLARTDLGPACVWQGARSRLGQGEPGPFAGRVDLDIVLAGVRDLMAMPSAGDLVIYGHGSPAGDISFIPERGAHAGPSAEELHTFIMHPASVQVPGPIVHPVQLHAHFVRYQEPALAGADPSVSALTAAPVSP